MEKMKTNTFALIILTILLGASSCTEQAEVTEREVRTVDVETEMLQPELFESYLRQVGTVTSTGDVIVAAEVSGVVDEVIRREGQDVRSGEPVVRLDNRQLRQEVRRLEAATNQSRENYERLQRLFENDDIGSEIDVINARYTYEQNLSQLESARINLENSVIKAPFSGTIENVLAEQGSMVSIGSPVFRIVDGEEKKIRLGVPARYSNAVDMGDMAEIWFNYEPDKRYTLPVTFIGNTIDPMNRTFRVDIDLPEELQNVKLEMIANVRIRTQYMEDVMIVNEEFLFQKENRYVVYVEGSNDQGEKIAVEREIQMGPSFENQTVVTNGINPGDVLITIGSSYLENGTRINTVENRDSESTALN
ncbi:efflux RND transporter periplasmic adaptor subunit [Rhodohalobacter mucosus]|nr:efflux RND transporter periplasmic adaptor subunit [Rhodohalobacter mucosus]